MLDREFFTDVATTIRDRYREHIFEKGLDVFGKRFPSYDKTIGSRKYGERKRNNKLLRQSSKYANSTAPVVTEDFLKDFSLIRVTNTGFQLGWGIYGARVKHLADRGRFVTHQKQPLPEPIINYMMKEVCPFIEKKKLPKSKTKRYKIGK